MTSLAPSSRLVRASLPLRLRNGSSPDPLAVTSLSARRHYSCVPHVATPTALPERPIHPRCARRTHARPPRRTFTTTPCPHAGSSIKNAKMIRAEMNKMKARTGPAPSIKLQTKQMQKQAIQDGSVLEQVQILPETFVARPWSERPSWLKEPKLRLAYELKKFSARRSLFMQLGAAKLAFIQTLPPSEVKALSTFGRMRYSFTYYNFESFRVARIGQATYIKMYTALAQGDSDTLRSVTKPGLYETLRHSLLPADRGGRWRIHRYLKVPKLVAYNVAMPNPDARGFDMAMVQQAVVEMDTLQSLTTKYDEEGVRVKHVREWVVLHKTRKDGKESEWRIWGMTKPTTMEDIKLMELQRLGLAPQNGAANVV